MNPFVVIPTFNEADNIENLVKHILKIHTTFNIIIVDDNSPDGTGAIADSLSQEDSRIHVIHRPYKAGLGTAYVDGFKDALAKGADLIFEMDADFSHNPEYLQDFLDASQKYDLVIGSRYINGVRVEGWRFFRLLISKFANIFISNIMVKKIWDFTSGFRCYRRVILETLDLDSIKSDGYAFQIEMTYLTFKNNFTILEIPIIFRERERGVSKISRYVIWEAFWLTLKYRAPLLKIVKNLLFLTRAYYREYFNSNSSKLKKNV